MLLSASVKVLSYRSTTGSPLGTRAASKTLWERLRMTCLKHKDAASPHHEETIRPKMEPFSLMVQTETAEPSKLPSWYSPGVSTGAFLCRAISLHYEGVRGFAPH